MTAVSRHDTADGRDPSAADTLLSESIWTASASKAVSGFTTPYRREDHTCLQCFHSQIVVQRRWSLFK